MGETSSTAAPIVVEAGDTIYTLAFSASVFRRVEAASGLTFGQLIERCEQQSFQAVAWLLRAALWRDHPNVSDEEIDVILDEYGIPGLTGTDPSDPGPLTRALERDLPGQRNGGNPRTPKRRTGTRASSAR